jgi:hypothetical protein
MMIVVKCAWLHVQVVRQLAVSYYYAVEVVVLGLDVDVDVGNNII